MNMFRRVASFVQLRTLLISIVYFVLYYTVLCLSLTISRLFSCYRIDGVMVSVLTSIDRGFEPRSGQTKDYKIGTVFVDSSLRRKSKDWLAPNQNCFSEWSDMSYPRTVVSVS